MVGVESVVGGGRGVWVKKNSNVSNTGLGFSLGVGLGE